MLESVIFFVVLAVLGLGNLICCVVSLRKSIKDRRSVLVRRKLRAQQNATSHCPMDALLSKSPSKAVSSVPLPKFALSKSGIAAAAAAAAVAEAAASSGADVDADASTDCTDKLLTTVSADEPAPSKEGLRNFSYKLSMSGDYDHIYSKRDADKLLE